MAKKVIGQIKLQIPAGKATPAPPVGPALGQHGVNIMEFTKQYNAKTADQAGLIIPVVITVYQDRSFSFITKTPPAAVLIKKSRKDRIGIRRAEQEKGGKDHIRSGARDRRAENAGPECGIRRSGDEHDRRNGKKYGNSCRRLILLSI